MSLPPLRIFLIGASRGLGAAVAREICKDHPAANLCLLARKRPLLEGLQKELGSHIEIAAFDISREGDQAQALEVIARFKPTHIWSFVGGGPHGLYQSKDFKDHLWAWNVSFLFNARLLHGVLRDPENYRHVLQLLFVGSDIAEAKADPLAASYAAAKHALKGLITSVQAESANVDSSRVDSPRIDIRLVSPGYMKTDLLPATVELREQATEPQIIAQALVGWALSQKEPSSSDEFMNRHLRL
jgi:short-subunit dehydrogenase